MWRGGKDQNELSGESILLLDPKVKLKQSQKQLHTTNKQHEDPAASFVGGHPSYYPNDENYSLLVPPSLTSSTASTASTTSTTPCQNNQCVHKCAICHEEMYLLLQMYAPLDEYDRTMYVFACNKASCIQTSFLSSSASSSNKSTEDDNHRFSLGGHGVVKCIRSQRTKNSIQKQQLVEDQAKAKAKAQARIANIETKEIKKKDNNDDTWGGGGWGDDDDNENENGDDIGGWGDTSDGGWGDDDDDDNDAGTNNDKSSMDDLEAMLSAMEAKENEQKDNGSDSDSDSNNDTKKPTQKKDDKKKEKKKNPTPQDTSCIGALSSTSTPSFQKYELDIYDEPASKLNKNNIPSDNDDDDAIGITNKDDSIVQKMLSSYLNEEDDDDVKAAIRLGRNYGQSSSDGGGGNTGTGTGSSNKNGNGEKYERLPPGDRAFLSFTDRIRRAPYQAVRHAYDGIPMWSIPTPLTSSGKKGGKCRDTKFPTVPKCICGAERKFEFQLMPSLLHLLDVDKYYKHSNNNNNDTSTSSIQGNQHINLEQVLSKNEGGMNWGVIAIYSCSESCNQSIEEYVIIQESVDANPKKMCGVEEENVDIVDNDDDK